MRVAFFTDNSAIESADLSHPEKGNPGVGGTEYLMVSVPHAISELEGHGHEVMVLAPSTAGFPMSLKVASCSSLEAAPALCREFGADLLVFRPPNCLNALGDLAAGLEENRVGSVAWAHNMLDAPMLKFIARNPAFRAYVHVGHEALDDYRDLPSIYKSTYVFNAVADGGMAPKEEYSAEGKRIVFLGSLGRSKGFHRLAGLWPELRRRHPDLELHVIGSATLYNRGATLGPLGIAEPEYEAEIVPPLLNEQGEIDSRVVFHGTMGLEKIEVMRRASVGVVNPTGQTETFCLSAVEFELLGVPVVSAKEWGLLDTVMDGETGLLCQTDEQFIDAIDRLLSDVSLQERLGRNGRRFAMENFSFRRAAEGWSALFSRLEEGQNPRLVRPKRNLRYRAKWLKEVIRYGKKFIPAWRGLPAVSDVGGARVSIQMLKSLLSPAEWASGFRNLDASMSVAAVGGSSPGASGSRKGYPSDSESEEVKR